MLWLVPARGIDDDRPTVDLGSRSGSPPSDALDDSGFADDPKTVLDDTESLEADREPTLGLGPAFAPAPAPAPVPAPAPIPAPAPVAASEPEPEPEPDTDAVPDPVHN